MAEVNLDSKIKMLDSPGVVFDPSDTDGMVLRNCINVEDLEDPSQAVQSIVDRCRPVQLMQLYNVPAFTDVSQFLGHVARRTGKLGKGGVPDKISTAKNIVNDWNQGKIQYFTSPPKDEVVEAAEGFETQLVTEWGSDFDITKVQDLETIQPAGVDGGDTGMDTSDSAAPITMELAPRFPAPVARDIFAENSEDDDSDDDDEEETAPQPVVAETKAKGALNKRKRKEMDSLASLLEGSMAVKKGDGAKEDSNDMEGSDGEGSSSVVAKKEPSKKKKKKSRRRAAERNDTSSAATTPKEETASSSANAGSASKKKKVATKAKASADSFDFDAVFQ
jgi:nuclear GTP-binding protein